MNRSYEWHLFVCGVHCEIHI